MQWAQQYFSCFLTGHSDTVDTLKILRAAMIVLLICILPLIPLRILFFFLHPFFDSGMPLLPVRPGFEFWLTYITVQFPPLLDAYYRTCVAESLGGTEQVQEAKALWNSREP